MVGTGKKKANGTTVYIAPWCLDVLVMAPSAEEVAEMRERIATNHDDARLPDVYEDAAFALMARMPTTRERYFGNLDLRLLSHRDNAAKRMATDLEPEIFAAVVAALREKEKSTKPSTKPPVKKAK